MPAADILIVEDERIVAKDLERELEFMGHRVCGIASCGRDALEIAEAKHPDLVLMDIHLKGNLDGIHLAKEMKNRFNTPVLYLTGYADDGTIERAKETQPVGYMVKPFRERELRAAIEVALNQRKSVSLKERELWYSQILQSMSDAVVATDNAGLVKFMNLSAELLTGRKLGAAFGKDFSDVVVFKGERLRRPSIDLFDALQEEGPVFGWLKNATITTPEGSETQIEYTHTLVKDFEGNPLGAVIVMRDVTRRLE